MKFSLLIQSEQCHSVKYAIGQMNRYEKKIMILEEIQLSGVQSGEPDVQLILFLCSENLSDIFQIGWASAKEKIHFQL
jgi:hypothetical protein